MVNKGSSMIYDDYLKSWFDSHHEDETRNVVSIFNVEYAHIKLPNDDDLFLTPFGLAALGEFDPIDFRSDSPWFKKNALRLDGTGCVYKVPTRARVGKVRDVIIKWNRMGEDVPGKRDYESLLHAEFNSPFEEMGLLKDLRDDLKNNQDHMLTQNPLAIYVPSERYQLWQTGRRKLRMKTIIDSHTEIELDMNRMYMMVFEWLEGVDAAQAFEQGLLNADQVKEVTMDAAKRLESIGYVVRDNKPNHIILKKDNRGHLMFNQTNNMLYGLIDYELLERTQKQKIIRRAFVRRDYHRRQKNRFVDGSQVESRPHLHHVNILGVDYIFGRVESTRGRLWVVGKDPFLFDYFLPERWEGTKRTKISMFSESYYTVTKDNIHIVWEDSKVGLIPDMDPFKKGEKRILDHGYNSPFEEVALAVELSKKGMDTIYPRAIYMPGSKTEIMQRFLDESRYKSHENIVNIDGLPVLLKSRSYLIIWGYWNGPDEKLAEKDDLFYDGINLLYAYRDGLISYKEYMDIVKTTRKKLQANGIEDLNLSGKHILISMDNHKKLVRDEKGSPDIRLCNFEFLKKNQ